MFMLDDSHASLHNFERIKWDDWCKGLILSRHSVSRFTFILPIAKSWALPSTSSLSSGLIYTTVWKDWDGESHRHHTHTQEGGIRLSGIINPTWRARGLKTVWNSVSRVREAGERTARSGLPLSWPLAAGLCWSPECPFLHMEDQMQSSAGLSWGLCQLVQESTLPWRW